jgi:hypothetical protein
LEETSQLTVPLTTVLAKLTVALPVKKIPAVYEIIRLITVFTRTLHWSLFSAR